MKTAELTGVALDWAVSKAEGMDGHYLANPYSYSTNWIFGGSIIEREFITVGPYHGDDGKPTGVYQAYIGWSDDEMEPLFQIDGTTPLIAAMRCYVASKLGDDVEIPTELQQ